MSGLGYFLIYAGFAVFVIGTIRHRLRLTLADVTANAMIATGWALIPSRAWAVFAGAVTVLTALYWWRSGSGRRRRRALRELGAKSRARIAAMVTRMRERPPRPALRPVPAGGAR